MIFFSSKFRSRSRERRVHSHNHRSRSRSPRRDRRRFVYLYIFIYFIYLMNKILMDIFFLFIGIELVREVQGVFLSCSFLQQKFKLFSEHLLIFLHICKSIFKKFEITFNYIKYFKLFSSQDVIIVVNCSGWNCSIKILKFLKIVLKCQFFNCSNFPTIYKEKLSFY